MRICYTLLYAAPGAPQQPAHYLRRFPLLAELPPRLAVRGHDVYVVISHGTNATCHQRGVQYRFVREGIAARSLGVGAGRLLGRPSAFLTPAKRAIREVRRRQPDLVHFHGLNLHLNSFLATVYWAGLGVRKFRSSPEDLATLELLRTTATSGNASTRPSLVLQDHGSRPSSQPLARWLQRRTLAHADKVLFTAKEHVEPYQAAGFLRQNDARAAIVLETSTILCSEERATRAPNESRLAGRPTLLTVARLDAVKDPDDLVAGL